MPPPDFNKPTVDTLWKRAASMCSNPDCRAQTSGPVTVADEVANIGEAAHIYGARPTAKRYRSDMTDIQRAEITNGIWLCRNCHRLTDSDDIRFSADLLFEWRRTHEAYAASRMGRQSESAISQRRLEEFQSDTYLAQQIVRDGPPGWEYRLTAELLRSYLKKPIRRWRDLSTGLYSRSKTVIDDVEIIGWLQSRMADASEMVGPIQKLISYELEKAWGAPGVPGDAHEIRHTCGLIRDGAERIVDWEEQIQFAVIPDEYQKLHSLLPGLVGSQMIKLESVPSVLNESVDWALQHPGEPRVVHHTVVFEISDRWTRQFEQELEALTRRAGRRGWFG